MEETNIKSEFHCSNVAGEGYGSCAGCGWTSEGKLMEILLIFDQFELWLVKVRMPPRFLPT